MYVNRISREKSRQVEEQLQNIAALQTQFDEKQKIVDELSRQAAQMQTICQNYTERIKTLAPELRSCIAIIADSSARLDKAMPVWRDMLMDYSVRIHKEGRNDEEQINALKLFSTVLGNAGENGETAVLLRKISELLYDEARELKKENAN